MFLVGAFCSEKMALQDGGIVMSIELAYKRKVLVTCMKNVLPPFESGGLLPMTLEY